VRNHPFFGNASSALRFAKKVKRVSTRGSNTVSKMRSKNFKSQPNARKMQKGNVLRRPGIADNY
jgi:hypothetical protein